MKYPAVITALLLPLAAHAAPQEAVAAPQSQRIEAQATIDPAFLEKLKADGVPLPKDGEIHHLEVHAIPASPIWSASESADLNALQQFLNASAGKREPWLKESYSVAMKAAAFLATGKPGAPAPGRQQSLDLTVRSVNNGNPGFISAVVTFIGRDDEKLPGERFELDLHVKGDGTWSITKATRSTLSPGPALPEE